MFHNGMTDSEQDYEICFRQENVFLPSRGYFGLSAATGGLAGKGVSFMPLFVVTYLEIW